MEQLQSAHWGTAAAIAGGAYALGCFTTGYYLARGCAGKDIREFGSGNVGARNVGRAFGVWGFLATLIGDLGKGAFAVWAARHFSLDALMPCLALLCVVAGHVWPVQLGFRGGKGIATSLGALAVYDFRLAIAFLVFFAVSFLFVRKTVLPGLFAFAVLPVAAHYFDHDPVKTFAISLLAGIVLMKHRKNLQQEIPAMMSGPEAVEPEPKEHHL